MQRNQLHHGVEYLRVLGQGRGELGVGQPGQYRVDPNAVSGQFLGKALGHVDDAGLGHRIDQLARRGALGIDRRDIDDRAAAMIFHASRGLNRGPEVAAQIDLDGLLIGRQIHIDGRPEIRVSGGIVHQQAGPQFQRVELGEHRFDRARLADVHGHRLGAAAGAANGLGHGLAAFLASTGADHVRPVRSQ